MTVDRLKDLLTTMLEHPDFRPGMPSLWDLRNCDLSLVDAPAMRALRDFNIERSEARGRARVALVTATDVGFGIMRMYEARVDVPTAVTRVFRDRAEAEHWIFEEPAS